MAVYDSGMRIRMTWALQLFVVLAAVWLALNGLDGWPLGLLAAAVGATFGAWIVPAQPYPWKPWRLAGFIAFFVYESVRGALDVAGRALLPGARIDPSFVPYRSRLPAGQPLTLMVSVTSLLPGTLSVGLDEATGDITVHLLTPAAADSVKRLEARLAWLFSVDLDREDR